MDLRITGVSRVLVDVCCSSCSLCNLLASHSSQLPSFVFLFVFVSWNSCPHCHLLVAYTTPKKEAENPDFLRLLGQRLTYDLAIIYAAACWLVICMIGRAKKRFWASITLTYRPSTLKIRNTWTTPNAIQEDELQRSTTGTICVLVDVCCTSCSLSNLASHSSHLLSFVFLSIFVSGTLARIITAWSLMRPLRKRLKIPISFAYWIKA